jgi:hypothetical protein
LEADGLLFLRESTALTVSSFQNYSHPLHIWSGGVRSDIAPNITKNKEEKKEERREKREERREKREERREKREERRERKKK